MIKHLKRKPSFLSLLVGVLLVLLAVIATLQYRWLGRVSAGERELMQANLRVKARSFGEEFDREISRAFTIFKMDADTLRGENTNSEYAKRYDKWVKTSENPQIVKNVFLAKASDGGRFQLLRFNEALRAFEQIEWTSELEVLHRRFEQRQTSKSETGAIFTGGTDSIVEEIPALVYSIVSDTLIDSKTNYRRLNWQHPLGYVIVALDLDYIKEEFFPILAKSYFASGETLDYNLTVTSRNDVKKVIYQSDPEFKDVENSIADASEKILNISFNKVKSYSSERIYQTPKSPNQNKSDFTLIIPAMKDDEAAADKILLLDDGGHWELRVNHRAGSLDAAVANARWWNLATSFGILLLLGISIIMIVVLSSRSQKLARRQVEFVAGVSHEFRTPLAVIYSLSENLAAGRIKDSRQVERYGATIHKDVRRLTEMVEQVLEFAGAERGKYFYDKNPVNVGQLVEKILTANAPLLRESGWHVEKRIEPELPPVSADESALERAVQNLINNAVKYGGDSGDSRYLKVEAYRATNGQKPEVEIAVEDNGNGILPAELPHIFEPFFRGEEATLAQIHGSGLGLNLVKQIVEAHGGRVKVESTRGRGSRFVLHLPALAAGAASLNPPQTSEVI